MATATILGPNGRPLLVTNRPQGPVEAAVAKQGALSPELLAKVNWGVVEGLVEKRVRSQATSLTQVWDPRRGKPKPTSVTFDTLRMMSNRNEWCSAIIKTRINQIGKVKWSVKPKDEDDSSPSTERLCEETERLLQRPSLRGSRPHSRSWRQFIGEVLRDILVLDAGCIEKERNGRGWIVAMYPVDGATIAPNIDDRGGYPDDAYVQIVDGQVTARFGMEDLVYIMDNPQTDVKFSGYGFSPLEWLIVSVTADLYSSKYNASYFEKGSVPEGIVNLGEDVSPDDVDAFRLYWMNEIMGKPWSLPIIGGKGVEWIPWRASNKDMEYMEYQRWLMQRMCAVYQIAPQEVGMLEDVNRSTADEQQESNHSKSIEPILTLIQDYFEVEVIGEHGLGIGDLVTFSFDLEDENAMEEIEKVGILVDKGAATRNELREAAGKEPFEDEGADMLLVAGQLNPLPNKQDVEILSATGQAKQEQDQADQQAQQQKEMGVGDGKVPWKPANPADPDVQAAQGQHELSSGLGPKQLPVGKTAAAFLPTHYHVAPAAARSSIRQHGLDYRLGVKAEHHDHDSAYAPGNYLFGDEAEAKGLAHAKRDATSEPHDVWLVNALEHHLHDDQHPDEFRSAVYTTQPIERRHLSLGDVFKTDRNPALTRVHDSLEDVFEVEVDELLGDLQRLLGIPLAEAREMAELS